MAEDQAPCRVVDVTWDRGHEDFEAIVRAESGAGVKELIAVYQRRTGSGGFLVGRVTELSVEQVRLDDISPKGVLSDQVNEYQVDDIISVAWGTEYLLSLAELLAAESGGSGSG